ncbi:hypothetical protein MRB53_006137 [Persea americana]|uniref:Uncharacterized protein n=1 Tax=Persea americana TaxID=3435 RepID=A0ACC2MFI7_PERAE|nr:hypothetical protein MRB53_006137 [Persea americana]
MQVGAASVKTTTALQNCRMRSSFSKTAIHQKSALFSASVPRVSGRQAVGKHGNSRISATLEAEKQKDKGSNLSSSPKSSSSGVRIVGIVGENSVSPLKCAPWEQVMLHTAKRLKWVDEGFNMLVFSDNNLLQFDNQREDSIRKELADADLLVIVAVINQESAKWIKTNSETIPNIVCFESSSFLCNKLGGQFIQTGLEESPFKKVLHVVQGKNEKNGSNEVVKTISEAWERHNSDDIRFCILIIINEYIKPVTILKNLRSRGLSTINCIVKNCGSEILNCLLDPNCRKALHCLNSCAPTDQVCSYRCIASYESPKLEAFSLCVLQKNNCLGLDADIPNKPYVPPMSVFRDEDFSHDIAEDLFVGWLGRMRWSWRVVAGQNPAYDQFPCQYQLFYRGKAKGSFWYEPVFQVRTLEGDMVWRRRRYRVRRDKVPGTFYFSVLDNGVVSKEFWTIVDVCDDLSWGLFYYAGAAQAAGQSYTGAVLVSPNGDYPSEMHSQRLLSALEKCGIKEWELYTVDNCSCDNPPLGIPEGSSLYSKIGV